MRKFIGVLLLVLLSAGSAAAWDEFGFSGNIYGVAWLDGTKLIVALGNTSNNRINVSISTSVTDAWQWPVFPTRQISIPARTIVQEVFFPSTPGWGQKLSSVRITEGYRSFNVPIQEPSIFKAETYVVPANTNLTVTVDLDQLLDAFGKTRIVVDDYYTTSDGRNQDRVRIDSVGGGPTQVRGTNTIEFTNPHLVLKVKTPNIPWLTTMTFGLNKVDANYNWWQERYDGPIFLVYGRNMRMGESSSGGGFISR